MSRPVESLLVTTPRPGDLPCDLGMTPDILACDVERHFHYTLGRRDYQHAPDYAFVALGMAVRDRLMERWRNTVELYEQTDCKQAFYLSMEFLLGRSLQNALLNLGIDGPAMQALQGLGVDLETLAEQEHDAGLGNGGLGRLAACFIDSCASLGLPVTGYGLRYEYGMFRQDIDGGYQVEEPDHWLRNGHVWEIERPERTVRVKFGGRIGHITKHGRLCAVHWIDTEDVLAVPYDIPVPGYQNGTVNTLRLWKSAATDEFNLSDFNAGDYADAVAAKSRAENISMVLYPNDASENGKELRLRQQYFLASASLQDILRTWVARHGEEFSQFAEKHCFQLNDTHPSIAVAELMRLLMDEHGLGWDAAWAITIRTMAYTNHTLLPEALERWPVWLFRRLLPRLLEIIFEINARFIQDVSDRWPGDNERLARMSLIEEAPVQMVRMAYLAIVGSFSVNGVAALHSDLLKKGLFHDFYELWPDKFNNKTNGVTPRRWLASCNHELASLIDEAIGERWRKDLAQLAGLKAYVDDRAFQERWSAIRRRNKLRLSAFTEKEIGCSVSPDAFLDVQVKRIHEYKRQLLNVLHVIHLYDRVKQGELSDWTPRKVLFGGKAAPGYTMAKLIIKLINNVAGTINHDPATKGLLMVEFLPDYRVTAMEKVCPAADLSEQVSTAGKEASGTGNMKFMMNGAVTIGTYDGANIEILGAVGSENFFLFGLHAADVDALRGHYDPVAYIQQDDAFARVMHLLKCGHFNRMEAGIFDPIIDAIQNPDDPWMIAADFRSYVDAQCAAAAAYRDPRRWTRMSIMNTACSGQFSSDRTIQEYNRDIWKLSSPVAA